MGNPCEKVHSLSSFYLLTGKRTCENTPRQKTEKCSRHICTLLAIYSNESKYICRQFISFLSGTFSPMSIFLPVSRTSSVGEPFPLRLLTNASFPIPPSLSFNAFRSSLLKEQAPQNNGPQLREGRKSDPKRSFVYIFAFKLGATSSWKIVTYGHVIGRNQFCDGLCLNLVLLNCQTSSKISLQEKAQIHMKEHGRSISIRPCASLGAQLGIHLCSCDGAVAKEGGI